MQARQGMQKERKALAFLQGRNRRDKRSGRMKEREE